MRIRMKVPISGTRNGQDWPPAGGELDVSDAEGMHLCQAGLAEPVVTHAEEQATQPPAETRVRRPRKPRTTGEATAEEG